jgi:hypothetical protein
VPSSNVNLTVHIFRKRAKDKKDDLAYYLYESPEDFVDRLAEKTWVAVGEGSAFPAILPLDIPEEISHTIQDALIAYSMGIDRGELHRQYCEELEKEVG